MHRRQWRLPLEENSVDELHRYSDLMNFPKFGIHSLLMHD